MKITFESEKLDDIVDEMQQFLAAIASRDGIQRRPANVTPTTPEDRQTHHECGPEEKQDKPLTAEEFIDEVTGGEGEIISDDELKQAVVKAGNAGIAQSQIKALLTQYGAGRLTELQGKERASFYHDLEKQTDDKNEEAFGEMPF